ncbi:MAG: hypothetical protein ACXADY_07930 [Candidatus Hodarchaeales archaeon]
MPSNLRKKFYPLLNVGVPTEIMIKILEETEGDPILKIQFLRMLTPTISKEKQNQRLGERLDPPEIDFNGYKDLNERINIFKKRLAILLKPEYRNE